MQWMRLFGALSSPVSGRVVLGPNWFASVMGTGMIAIAGALLPLHFAWIDQISLFAWFASSVFLVILLIVVPLHWLKHPQVLRALLDDPVAIQFFGAPPMAIMTVGTASLLTGQHYLGTDAALLIAEFCWVTGTVLGYLVAIAVPFRLFTQLKVSHDGAFGGWLMPVVPPMVSATGGAVIAPYIVDPILRESLILACYAMFGMSLTTSFMIITLIWSRLAHFGSSASVRVPTLWIVLGPVGQSVTAAGGLGMAAANTLPEPYAMGLKSLALLYGVPVWGFIWLWIPIATLLTLRAHQNRMGFALTWWSFTFPVGTCVTATCQLARHSGLLVFSWLAMVMYVALLGAWLIVLAYTGWGIISGHLLTPKLGTAPPVAKKISDQTE